MIAVQITNSYKNGVVPFYSLPQMGGSYIMRGYYQGGLRDNVLLDGQVEYRVPVWNIFGVVGWIGTGRVASSYDALSIDGFHINYGLVCGLKSIPNTIRIATGLWRWYKWNTWVYSQFLRGFLNSA